MNSKRQVVNQQGKLDVRGLVVVLNFKETYEIRFGIARTIEIIEEYQKKLYNSYIKSNNYLIPHKQENEEDYL